MRIEKISDTQIKFTLSKNDLDERDIKMGELAYGSEKTHLLFQEMMRQAHTECNFESENTPLMVEAMPVGKNHIVIVVTKISNFAEDEHPINLLPKAHGNDIFKTHGLKEPKKETTSSETLAVFSFKGLDEAAFAAKRLNDYFMGQSCLYKLSSRYYLMIKDDIAYSMHEAETILHEYGEKHATNYLSESYLGEHGELLIGSQAIEKMASYL